MLQSIFAYTRYKTFLYERIRSEPNSGHGVRNRLAQAMGCQLAYVSHVMNGDRDLSVEQAEAATRFFGLSGDEAEYFIWLVEWERAGTVGSKKFFSKLLEQKRTQHLEIRKRVGIQADLSNEDKSIYYSSYLYAAIHMLVTIPEFRSIQKIAEHLRQPISAISEILEFLKSRGLITERKGFLETTSKFLFVGKNSPFVVQHHSNWRIHALQSIAKRSEEEMHLSMTVTLSERDAVLLKQRMASFIEEISETIKSSREEKLMNINLDFFSV